MRFITIFLSFISTRAMVVRPQLYSSPCPETFQYEMDQNGQIYGTIGVYSFDETIVRLNIELSVGNQVNVSWVLIIFSHLDLTSVKFITNQIDCYVIKKVKDTAFVSRWDERKK